MTTSMDIVLAFDCSLLVSFYEKNIKQTSDCLVRLAASCNEGVIRMASTEFQSHTSDWFTKTHPFTSSMNEFQTWVTEVRTEGVTPKECKEIASVLNGCLTLDWRSNTDLDRCHEKLVVLFTDGPPCNLLNNECCSGNLDLWKIADQFEEQGIVLVIVGLGPCLAVCEDFYCAMARKTGGEYIPLINAPRVLSSVVRRAIFGDLTLSRLIRNLDMHDDIEANSLYNHSSNKKRISFMYEYCRTMTDIRKWLYSFGPPSKEVEFCLPDFDEDETDFEPGGLPQGMYMNMLLTSTPLTDDEGYRTRLPTTASLNSSFYSTEESADSSDEIDGLILSCEILDNSA